jgi:hypothetical protein
MSATQTIEAPELPSWVDELESSIRFHSQYVLAGNIRDLFWLPQDTQSTGSPVIETIWKTLNPRGCTWLVSYDRIDGLILRHQDEDAVLPEGLRVPATLEQKKRGDTVDGMNEELRHWLKATQSPSGEETSGALIIDYASRLSQPLDGPNAELTALFQLAEKASIEASAPCARSSDNVRLPFSPVIWLADNAHDIPDFLRVDNDRVRTVMVGLPSRATRSFLTTDLVASLRGPCNLNDEQASRFAHRYVLMTEGMKLSSIYQVNNQLFDWVRMLRSRQDTLANAPSTDPVQELDRIIRSFRVGATRDPWRDPSVHSSIRGGFETISANLKGQDHAVRKALDILKRSVTGLSGAQAGRSAGRPRGVLFFAGPTGVGKTELAKQITRVLFGDESAYHRFDMSEFSAEHSEARLIGAPPGYVGHDAGGQLVNCVRTRPFSVLLFDEIEKAHPRILDKFLQILEDGRLTDGRGDTVYFSEAVIIFTSNLGIYREEPDGARIVRVPNVTAHSAPSREDVEAAVIPEIENYFRYKLERPELLNRIGKNVLVFDFIRERVAREIMRKMLRNVTTRVTEEHQVQITLSEAALQTLQMLCLAEASINGGRGIGNALEEALVNPLARALFEKLPLEPGTEVQVTHIQRENGEWIAEIA